MATHRIYFNGELRKNIYWYFWAEKKQQQQQQNMSLLDLCLQIRKTLSSELSKSKTYLEDLLPL